MKKKMNRILSIFLVILLFLSAVPLNVSASDGTHILTVPDDYIGVYTIEDLYCVRYNLSASYILMNDIDLSEATAEGGDWNFNGRGWNPIGSGDTYGVKYFQGIFDGNGYSITGMNIDISSFPTKRSEFYIGLFAGLASYGSIKNLTVEGNIYLKCHEYYSSWIDTYIGGIVADCVGGHISNCVNKVNIIENKAYEDVSSPPIYNEYIGGIAGCISGSDILDCLNLGNITVFAANFEGSDFCIGGIVGNIAVHSEQVSRISRCINTATLNAELLKINKDEIGKTTAYVGGICGWCGATYSGSYSAGCYILDCFNTADISTKKNCVTSQFRTFAAGICAGNAKKGGYTADIGSCYNIGNISTSNADTNKAIAEVKCFLSDPNKSYFLSGTGKNTSYLVIELTNAQMKIKSMYSGWDFDNIWTMEGRDDYPYPELRSVALVYPDVNTAHQHSYFSSVITPATHFVEGLMKYTCVCGDSYTEAIEKLPGHTYVSVITAPNCTQQGFTTYTCACGDSYVSDYTDMTGHTYRTLITTPSTHIKEGFVKYACVCGESYTETIAKLPEHTYVRVTTAPNCSEQGFTTYTCACGDSYVSDYTDAIGHIYKAVITTPATHFKEGIMTYTCVCGESYTEAIEKLPEHTYVRVTTAPNCTEQGFTTYTCACGDSYVSDYTDAIGHIYKAVITTPATHFKEGLMTYTCVCGESYTEAIEKLTRHIYDRVIIAPNCTERGFTTYTCACGDSYVSDYTDATGHIYNAVITTPATHFKEGLITYTCVCGESYTEAITKLPTHTYNAIVTVPSCTKRGYTTYACGCGDSYVADYVDATGHNHTSEITTPATHLSDGVKTFTCVCGDNYTETIAKLTEHTYNSIVTVPDCINKGYTTYICECGDTYVTDYVEATSHVEGKWTVVIPADIGKEGLEKTNCTLCGKEFSRTIGALEDDSTSDDYIFGDIDGDKKITAADARLALRASVGLEVFTAEQTKNADVDGTSGISAADARLILRASVGLEDPKQWLK